MTHRLAGSHSDCGRGLSGWVHPQTAVCDSPLGGLVHKEAVGETEHRVERHEDEHLLVHEAVDGAAPVEEQPRERPQSRVRHLQQRENTCSTRVSGEN